MKRLPKHKPAYRRQTVTPLGAVARGLAAGALGTLAMDGWMYARYRRGGGTIRFNRWESSSGVKQWTDAPAPAQVGRRLIEGLFQRTLPDSRAALMNNVTHWGYGIASAASYGVVAGSAPNARVRYGALLGSGLWLTSYAVLPAAGLYEPMWKYDKVTLANDLAAHLVYGLSTAATFMSLLPKMRSAS